MTATTRTRYSPKHPVIVSGVGPVPAPGMIIGEAPGRTEIEQGIPFCGLSGKLLDDSLQRAGRLRTDYWITNAFMGDVGAGNRNPTSEEIDNHWPILRSEIDAVGPRGILLLGAIATRLFIPTAYRMGDVVGTRIEWADGIHLFPTWHPAYVLRQGPSVRAEFDSHVVKFSLVTEVLDGLRS